MRSNFMDIEKTLAKVLRIYRIMNAKRDEITQFLDDDLLPQVREALSDLESGDRAEIEAKLKKVEAQASEAGFDPADSLKVKELKAQPSGV